MPSKNDFWNSLETTNSLATKTKLIDETTSRISSKTYNDWRDDLFKDGFVVVKGVLKKCKAKEYKEEMFKYLSEFSNNEFDINNRDTWTQEILPVHHPMNLYHYYSCNHEKFVWDIRSEKQVIDTFAQIWGTTELLVSFDGFNVTFPNRKDVPRQRGWPHVDQSPHKRGMQCVQGIVNLSHSGENDGGLVVYKNSHLLFERFFDEVVPKERWNDFDFFSISETELQWFLDNGCEEIKVNAEEGDIILWDSRTVHWGKEPEPSSTEIRSLVYVCYTPSIFATEDSLKAKKVAFEEYLPTTHWPHDNIIATRNTPLLQNGNVDPRNRNEPLRKPILSDVILKSAGIKPY
ncbi:uncharacterized protein RJT20DRAFT_63751 [Scheffersomyces xylosifermentans]|uniref:uncharacterized protein n=1 Tax=Scheffersomyces xylosifermentans TaxID=1304137 RepID=UPI00315C656D